MSPSPAPEIPPLAAIHRYGNLQLQLWSPPENGALAANAFEQLLGDLAASAHRGLLIGFRPGRVLPALAAHPDPALDSLLQQVTAPAADGDFHELPPATLERHLARLAAGSLYIRGDAQPLGERPARQITHVGRPALIVPLEAIAPAFARHADTLALHRLVSVSTNPLAGYAQAVGRRVKTLAQGLHTACLVTWNGQHLGLMAADDALASLHAALRSPLS